MNFVWLILTTLIALAEPSARCGSHGSREKDILKPRRRQQIQKMSGLLANDTAASNDTVSDSEEDVPTPAIPTDDNPPPIIYPVVSDIPANCVRRFDTNQTCLVCMYQENKNETCQPTRGKEDRRYRGPDVDYSSDPYWTKRPWPAR